MPSMMATRVAGRTRGMVTVVGWPSAAVIWVSFGMDASRLNGIRYEKVWLLSTSRICDSGVSHSGATVSELHRLLLAARLGRAVPAGAGTAETYPVRRTE
jgi:hypothetical protein